MRYICYTNIIQNSPNLSMLSWDEVPESLTLFALKAITGSFLFATSSNLADNDFNWFFTFSCSIAACSDGYGCAVDRVHRLCIIAFVMTRWISDDKVTCHDTLAFPLHTSGPKIYLILLNCVLAPPYFSDFTGRESLSVKIPSSMRPDPIVSQLQIEFPIGDFSQVPSSEHWQPVSEEFLAPLQYVLATPFRSFQELKPCKEVSLSIFETKIQLTNLRVDWFWKVYIKRIFAEHQQLFAAFLSF